MSAIDFDDDIGLPPCPQCGGQGVALGVLGTLAHHRCRACGWQFALDLRDGVRRVDDPDDDA